MEDGARGFASRGFIFKKEGGVFRGMNAPAPSVEKREGAGLGGGAALDPRRKTLRRRGTDGLPPRSPGARPGAPGLVIGGAYLRG